MSHSRPTIAEKRQTFRKLHEAGCFVIPNPWDVGTARCLQGLGFKALATTTPATPMSLGFPDGGLSVDAVLSHYRELAEATDVPLNADFEDGFADDPEGVAANIARCIATGVAGLSVEDSPKDAPAALRSQRRGGARQSRARGRRSCRRRRGVHRPRRELHPRRARSRRRHSPAEGLRGRRRRLPLCAGDQDARADRGGGQGGGAEAGEFPRPAGRWNSR